jgi:hypothetical protein
MGLEKSELNMSWKGFTVRFLVIVAGLLALQASVNSQNTDSLKSRAELSNYEETSSYNDVTRFIDELKKRGGPLLHVESFGETEEKKAMPLLVLSNPAVGNPKEAVAVGKPVVLVMANIHAGEVEGKEASLHLARRMISGDLRPVLDKLVVLIAPNYNADGNEKMSLTNRTDQNGPVGGVGTRENAKGFDLNRDFMKLDSAEARALVRLIARWDPALTVDLHTTDGSYHGYHLTYAPPLNPNADRRLIAYERDKMLPSITQTMLKNHKFRTYYYGNFSAKESMGREFRSPPNDGTPIWRTFDHRPRYGNNYVGLRNRLTILSEAYSHLDFKGRVGVTEAFVEEILKYSAAHAAEIMQLVKTVDRDAVQRKQAGVAFEMKPLPQSVDILVGETERVRNSRTGGEMTSMVGNKFRPVRMPDYGLFATTRSTSIPRAYIFRREAGLQPVIENLQTHGVAIEELTAPVSLEVDAFAIDEVVRAERAFQNHNEVAVRGAARKETINFPAGSVVVRTTQSLSSLIFYLLEPESDDGLTVWNFFDSYLGKGKTHPVYKLAKDVKIATRPLR